MANIEGRKAKAKSGKPSGKRNARAVQSTPRTIILDTTERLMQQEGYAAVSTRRVAKEAGLTPPLIHYYFPTTDDLFLAVFHRAAEVELAKLDEALKSPGSLHKLWATYCNHNQTTLAIEFMALANHRKAIAQEIAALTEQNRLRRAEVLATLLDMEGIKPSGCSAAGLSVLLIGVARTLVMESGLGISLGHADAKKFVEWWLTRLEKPSA